MSGNAAVMLSFLNLSSIGVRLPIQISSANTAPVASIFMPETVTPIGVLGDDLQGRVVALLPGKQLVARMPVGGVTAKHR